MDMVATRPEPQGLHRELSLGPPRGRISPVARCMALVADELDLAEGLLNSQLREGEATVSAIGGYLAVAGGKRMRPLLTALGARAAGFGGPLAALMCAGEVLHLGSLLHDDVVDEAEERRGRPAAQRVFGNAGVILTGDVCLARAVRLAAEHGGLRAVTELCHVVVEMSEGEVIQLRHRGDLDLPLPRYMEIIERKSAALISWCAAAGAWASGDERAADGLRRFGRGVGIAFQITDDVLDYVGDPALTGKAVGRDLAERKLTLPLLCALARDPGLRAALSATSGDERAQAALLLRVVESGGPAEALRAARAQVEGAVGALSGLSPGPHREALEELGWHLVERVR